MDRPHAGRPWHAVAGRGARPVACALPIALALALLAACAQPLPAEKAAYAGRWSAPGFDLDISQEGGVRYRRKRGGATTTINGPLQRFDGDDFRVGIGPFATSFAVDVPPRRVDGQWRMTVDGVELRRSE